MNMFIFTLTNPKRDSDLENSILIHELTHGLSNRLTGGPQNSNCLSTPESGGMGEGWSDALAFIFAARPDWKRTTNYKIGEWVLGNGRGIRTHPYSTLLNINPSKYSDIATRRSLEVHAIGEVWASMLYEVYWNVVEIGGYTENLAADARGNFGNVHFLQMLLDGMKIQPCNPTFVQARDAILAAEKVDHGGKYKCAIWKGFAKRGLGASAGNMVDAFDLPGGC
jgi:extracellular elastinolytic metalloproteinase